MSSGGNALSVVPAIAWYKTTIGIPGIEAKGYAGILHLVQEDAVGDGQSSSGFVPHPLFLRPLMAHFDEAHNSPEC